MSCYFSDREKEEQQDRVSLLSVRVRRTRSTKKMSWNRSLLQKRIFHLQRNRHQEDVFFVVAWVCVTHLIKSEGVRVEPERELEQNFELLKEDIIIRFEGWAFEEDHPWIHPCTCPTVNLITVHTRLRICQGHPPRLLCTWTPRLRLHLLSREADLDQVLTLTFLIFLELSLLLPFIRIHTLLVRHRISLHPDTDPGQLLPPETLSSQTPQIPVYHRQRHTSPPKTIIIHRLTRKTSKSFTKNLWSK